jgi:hypothetical protein
MRSMETEAQPSAATARKPDSAFGVPPATDARWTISIRREWPASVERSAKSDCRNGTPGQAGLNGQCQGAPADTRRAPDSNSAEVSQPGQTKTSD